MTSDVHLCDHKGGYVMATYDTSLSTGTFQAALDGAGLRFVGYWTIWR